MNTPESKHRRDFLGKVLGVWALLSAVPVLNLIIRYITPVYSESREEEVLKLDKDIRIDNNSSKIVRFGKDPVIVVHLQTGQYKAFQARCTHLGCVVKYEGEGVPKFHCNCHGSVFDLTGKNIAGPAPRPLTPVKVTIADEAIVLTRIAKPTPS